ncbi:MAG: hypothetical protein J0L84_18825, partial [Verrucomicrobia bacterium]|nr:hypothetical protein [Verrucomicrobiota bacterium]
GASYWFAYAPPQSGWLDLDTQGSAFDTVLEVYTYDPPLLGYASLQSLACDNNGGPDGRSSRLRLRCETGRTYLIVVDGVNGARGLTHLNYRLETNGVVVVPPQAGPAPGPFAVAAGTRLELTVGAEGSAPLRYQWKLGTTVLETATNATLVLHPAALDQAGAYSVSIRNDAGAVESGPILVSVWLPPRVELAADGRGGRLRFAASGQAVVSVETSEAVVGGAWIMAARAAPGGAPVEVAIPPTTRASFFRIRID